MTLSSAHREKRFAPAICQSIHRCFVGTWIAAVILTAYQHAKADLTPQPWYHEASKQIRIDVTPLIEATSYIDGHNYVLTIKSIQLNNRYHPEQITVKAGSQSYIIPAHLLKGFYPITTTSHLIKVTDTGKVVGFVLRTGDGENTRQRLFRLDLKAKTIRREDFSFYSVLESFTKNYSLKKAKGDD